MQVLAQFYSHSALQMRLFLSIGIAVLLNAIYCLAYRYTSGNPATLFEAFSWGIINIAPWVAAVELGRSLDKAKPLLGLFFGAAILSLCLEIMVEFEAATTFDLVRRIPGALVAIAVLVALKYIAKRREPKKVAQISNFLLTSCDWVRSAGNYVEVHMQGSKPNLVRATLAHVTAQAKPQLVRIHRRYAVLPSAIDQVEQNHIRLKDGTRLPVGNRYREELYNIEMFAPSSQSH